MPGPGGRGGVFLHCGHCVAGSIFCALVSLPSLLWAPPLWQSVLIFSSAVRRGGNGEWGYKNPFVLLESFSLTSQFDIGFPGLEIRECKYYDKHQETVHFICCLKLVLATGIYQGIHFIFISSFRLPLGI